LRKVNYKKQGVGEPQQVGIVNRGTTSIVDGYMGTDQGFTDWMIWYDVKGYYSIDSTYSDDDYHMVFSDGISFENAGDMTENVQLQVDENSLDNYPNPFNPSTVIRYQVVKPGHVLLTVYNSLGQQIAKLVDKQQESGRYEVNFNAKNLASGIYFYRITANGFTAVKKMILTK